MSSIALPIPDFSRSTSLNYALPRNLSQSRNNTSTWGIFAITNSARQGKGYCLGQSSPLIRPRAAAAEGAPSDFGEFVAREARLDKDYWAAAWLRAACHWDGRESERNAENFKWLFAEREFVALRKKCDVQMGKNCKCILMVKKEEDELVKGVVGTLDLHVQYFSPGQTFPEERMVPKPLGPMERRASNSYGYILNLCVARSARRRGLATGMLQHAIAIAKEQGIGKVFLRVYGYNEAAVRLYEKVGFKAVEGANCSAPLMLLCLEVY